MTESQDETTALNTVMDEKLEPIETLSQDCPRPEKKQKKEADSNAPDQKEKKPRKPRKPKDQAKAQKDQETIGDKKAKEKKRIPEVVKAISEKELEQKRFLGAAVLNFAAGFGDYFSADGSQPFAERFGEDVALQCAVGNELYEFLPDPFRSRIGLVARTSVHVIGASVQVAQSRGKRARPIDTTKAKTKLEFKDPNQVFAAEFPDHKHTKSMADVWPKEQKTEQEWTVCNPVSSSKSSFSPSFSGSPSGYQSVSASSATVIVEEAATMPDASQAPSKPQLEQAVNLLKLVT